MKKMILAALLVSSATLGLASNVHADETNKIVENPEEKTEVGINFKTNEGSQVTKGPFKGHLAIVFNPTRFNFGSSKVAAAGSNNLVFDQEDTDPDVQEKKQFLVVNDDREKSDTVTPGKEWTVKARYSGLTAGTTELASSIQLTLGDVKGYDIGKNFDPVTQDYIPNNPNQDATAITDLQSGADKFVLGTGTSKDLTLTANNDITVFARKTAEPDYKGGVATQITNVKLLIPDGTGAAGKTFAGDITWTLADMYQP